MGAVAGTGEVESSEPSEGEVQTISDYIKFELSKEGQAVAKEDYLGDATNSQSKNSTFC